MYEVKVIHEGKGYKPKKKGVTVVCENCGCDDVEMRWWCIWDIKKQDWVMDSPDDDSIFCRDCGDSCELEEKEIAYEP